MLLRDQTFSGFSVDDIPTASDFYGRILGLPVTEAHGMLQIGIGSGKFVFAYPKPDHEPASFTILNIPTDDIDAAVADLRAKGVTFERYDGLTDQNGIARGIAADRAPDIAWFRDPAGNILSVLKNP